MKGLTEREIQWLEAFAKNHEFFASFLLHYKLKHRLSNNQYYWLCLHINQAEEHGDTLLTTEEITFLEEKTQNNENLRELLEIYKDTGYLENLKYQELSSLKTKIMGDYFKIKDNELAKIVLIKGIEVWFKDKLKNTE